MSSSYGCLNLATNIHFSDKVLVRDVQQPSAASHLNGLFFSVILLLKSMTHGHTEKWI